MALLLPWSGSVTPVGGLTVAVLVSRPVAEGSTRTVKVKVTLAPTGRLTVVARAPLPLLGPVTAPPPLLSVASQAARTPGGRRGEARSGRRSVTVAPVTALGPLLLTTIV